MWNKILLLVLPILFVCACSDEIKINFPPTNDQLVRLYKEKFNIQVSHVPIVYNAFPDHYVSTVYKSKNLFRLYINRDKEVGAQVISPVFPEDDQQVLCIIRLSAYLKAKIDSVKLQWEKAQDNINILHADYANSIGLDEAIVSFTNVNLYTNAGEFQVKD